MNEYGVATESRTVRFERVLPGPIERVWAFLTESEKRGKWFASGEMELRVGGRVELKFHNSELSPQVEPTPERYKQFERTETVGHITRLDPPRLLSFVWGEGPNDSEVTFELTPHGDNVQLILTHRLLRDREQMVRVSSGWHTHLGILIDRLNGREPGAFWPRFAGLEAEYEKRLPPD